MWMMLLASAMAGTLELDVDIADTRNSWELRDIGGCEKQVQQFSHGETRWLMRTSAVSFGEEGVLIDIDASHTFRDQGADALEQIDLQHSMMVPHGEETEVVLNGAWTIKLRVTASDFGETSACAAARGQRSKTSTSVKHQRTR